MCGDKPLRAKATWILDIGKSSVVLVIDRSLLLAVTSTISDADVLADDEVSVNEIEISPFPFLSANDLLSPFEERSARHWCLVGCCRALLQWLWQQLEQLPN